MEFQMTRKFSRPALLLLVSVAGAIVISMLHSAPSFAGCVGSCS